MDIEFWHTDEGGRQIGVGVSLCAPDGFDFSVMARDGYDVTAIIYNMSIGDVDGLIDALQRARALYIQEVDL